MNKIATANSQLSGERQGRALLTQELEGEKRKTLELETKYNQVFAKAETDRFSHQKQVEETKGNYQKLLRRQLDEEKEAWGRKLEEELRRQKEVLDKESLHLRQQQQPTPLPAISGSTPSSAQNSRSPSSTNLVEHEIEAVSFRRSSCVLGPFHTLLSPFFSAERL